MDKATKSRIDCNVNENICIEDSVACFVCLIICFSYIIYKYIENILSYSLPFILGYSSP